MSSLRGPGPGPGGVMAWEGKRPPLGVSTFGGLHLWGCGFKSSLVELFRQIFGNLWKSLEIFGNPSKTGRFPFVFGVGRRLVQLLKTKESKYI
jgi:hypothetical protein